MNPEAIKCLGCPKPRCSMIGCPVHTAIPECIRLYKEGRLKEAGEILFNNNPFSAVTSIVCNYKSFCYGACVLNAKKDPVRWYEIEQEISNEFLKAFHPDVTQKNDQKIAIIGAGPAGLSAAIFLAQKGYNVTVYDKEERIGGVLRYGIPGFRLDKSIVDEYERILKEYDISYHGNIEIGKDITLSNIRKEVDAVIVATGAIKENKLRIPGEEKENVINALAFLKDNSLIDKANKVVVIGGGNVAMDAARSAKRMGKDTYVYYRKTFENMPANPIEVEEAIAEGVKFEVFEAPVEVKDSSVIFRKCENVTDENGKLRTKILENTDHEVTLDALLVAAGETIDLSVFGEELPELNKWHYPEVDETNMTSFDGVFVAGDFILGAKTVVEAIASTKTAVNGIENYLNKEK